MRHLYSFAALVLISAAAAEDIDRSCDLRLVIGAAPGIKSATASDSKTPGGIPVPGADGKTTYSAKYGPWFETDVMLRTARGDGFGLVGGPGAFFSYVRGENSQPGLLERRKLTSYGVMASFGPSFQWDVLRIEVLPYIGIGVARTQHEFSTATSDIIARSHKGYNLVYGARAGIYLDGYEGLVGLQAGWAGFRAHVNSPALTTPSDTVLGSSDVIDGSGLFFAAVAGVAF